ncbi:hypothetical protein P153DRAFT_218850 [Dothidotthia symphoricarpi CBS 119687]|uniref:UBC core domain-containing protein n=1 Tax=Dothidotthia symphoricarpi CBS 119687 TaxID=1392245 RepID=A0A6A6AHA2_9PLEO|nr:uncharacterized protein P153DRAFT_218850 [Dothidotthia symphoricarpi CBS 119687]KAF2130475.1 hypothetical protein P153DRAFT_218850 [Dothidotthia symphoricarpi CBS 119687]
MPRRQFVADLQQAVEGVSIAGISDVQVGNDDGEFTFMCVADGYQIKISALIPELSDYPSSHMCMIFGSDNASATVSAILDETSAIAAGKTVPQILELVSRKLESTDRDGDQQMLDSQEFEEFEEEGDYDEEEEYFPGDEDVSPRLGGTHQHESVPTGGFTQATPEFRERVRQDLRTTKEAGLKVGYLGGLMNGLACYVSVSIRVSKLGISEEAMQAWQLQPNEYLVAIFHYPNGYKNMDDLKSYDAATARRNFSLRIGISTSYKPDLKEAIQAFTVLSRDEEKRREDSQQTEPQPLATLPKGFRNSFISRPLNELLEQRFHMILKYRYSGMPWQGAEAFYNDQISRSSHTTSTAGAEDRYYEPEQVSTNYPSLVMADHIQDSLSEKHSLPLVGMQFVLRHFVRCTEFCLICFNKMADDLQAIKPYVCDNPLCLYQYMSLGFGPSIEHEILSQPKVVDLLVSFCYASARIGKLKDFPSGLGLAVPPPLSNENGYADVQPHNYRGMSGALPSQQSLSKDSIVDKGAYGMRFNMETKEMLFEDRTKPCPVRSSDWVVIRMSKDPRQALHCRVVDASLYPSVKVSTPVIPSIPSAQNVTYPGSLPAPSTGQQNKNPTGSTTEFRDASFHVYNQNFDDLLEQQKRQAIIILLDILPPVKEMKDYLLRKTQSPLSAWVDRLPSAALGVLRWIIASNRACILQTDHEEETASNRKSDGRLYGMSGWAQFRFAMGAPDKERRFIQAVRQTSDRLHLKYPTLFAWHGSPFQNWHSIIREGLHFNDTLHGRAFGNGVYHSLDLNTSIGYSQATPVECVWSMSELKMPHALALNEVVNAPLEFVSKTPHLVVAQLDWIQTRYLFVKSNGNYATTVTAPTATETKPLEVLEQDPALTPRGASANQLVIPIRAVANSRQSKPENTTSHKRRKALGNSQYDRIPINTDDDDGASVATLEEDRMIFFNDDDEDGDGDFFKSQVLDPLPTPNSITGDKGKSRIGSMVSNGLSKLMGSKKALTDYVPGTLDYSTLPMLQHPAWATTSATKCLMKDFKSLIHVQNTTPAHELGWHIDQDKMENMYQWIVELHSFDPVLPLAKEMKQRNIKSVVLELRFGKDYPMSPPFVRVIRPRFLGFQAGGGGHVTAGGAMCMQLLTNDGWTAVSSIESVLLQVRVAISSTDPKPARLEPGGRIDYGVGEAVEAYMRACAVHGWTVPAGFKEMAYGGSQGAGFSLI